MLATEEEWSYPPIVSTRLQAWTQRCASILWCARTWDTREPALGQSDIPAGGPSSVTQLCALRPLCFVLGPDATDSWSAIPTPGLGSEAVCARG